MKSAQKINVSVKTSESVKLKHRRSSSTPATQLKVPGGKFPVGSNKLQKN